MSEQANPTPNPQVSTHRAPAAFDFREAFWEQWAICCGLMSRGETLTGAMEALYATARLVGDETFEKEWRDRPVHGSKDRNGEWVLIPTLPDNLRAFEIIGDLARRQRLVQKQRVVAELAPLASTNGKTPSNGASHDA